MVQMPIFICLDWEVLKNLCHNSIADELFGSSNCLLIKMVIGRKKHILLMDSSDLYDIVILVILL